MLLTGKSFILSMSKFNLWHFESQPKFYTFVHNLTLPASVDSHHAFFQPMRTTF